MTTAPRPRPRTLVVLVGLVALVGVAPTALAQAPPTTAPATTLVPTTTAAPTTEVPRGQVPPAPVLVVEPDTGLVDGQVVSVSGSGWFTNDVFTLYFCGDEVGDISQNCIEVGSAPADRITGEMHDGTATLPIQFTTAAGVTIDCRVQSCRVFATNYRGPGDTALVTFADVIAATPAFTG